MSEITLNLTQTQVLDLRRKVKGKPCRVYLGSLPEDLAEKLGTQPTASEATVVFNDVVGQQTYLVFCSVSAKTEWKSLRKRAGASKEAKTLNTTLQFYVSRNAQGVLERATAFIPTGDSGGNVE